jgi:signal transduction histidine kinase
MDSRAQRSRANGFPRWSAPSGMPIHKFPENPGIVRLARRHRLPSTNLNRKLTMQTTYKAALLAMAVAFGGTAFASDDATKDDAQKYVKKGVEFIKANGKDKGYAEVSNKQGQFIYKDLYLVVYGLDGTVRAHGANEKMIGKNLIDLKDIDGKAFVKERVELAQSKGTFWQDYKFTNPVTKKIEPKEMYCEKLDDAVVCGGVYK